MPSPSDILSDPEIAQAYEDVRSDKSETTWLVLKYASATSDNLTLAKTGTGDIAEMTEVLGDDEAAYAYVRMKLGNDEYSERTKFVFVVWQGKYGFEGYADFLFTCSLIYIDPAVGKRLREKLRSNVAQDLKRKLCGRRR